jgi:hypothetical protein
LEQGGRLSLRLTLCARSSWLPSSPCWPSFSVRWACSSFVDCDDYHQRLGFGRNQSSIASAGNTCTTGPAIIGSALTSAQVRIPDDYCASYFKRFDKRSGPVGMVTPRPIPAWARHHGHGHPHPRLVLFCFVRGPCTRWRSRSTPAPSLADSGAGKAWRGSERAAPASRVDHATVRVPVLRLVCRFVIRGRGGEGVDLGEQLRQQCRQGPLGAPHGVHPRSPPRRGLGVRPR